MTFRNDDDFPLRLLRGCYAEGDEGEEGAGGSEGEEAKQASEEAKWYETIEDESLRGAVSGFESRDKLLEGLGVKPEAPKDWREAISDDKVKELAKSSTDINDFGKRALEMRQKLTKAITVPGKDATAEEIAEFHKKIGAADKPEGYADIFPAPAKGETLPDAVKEEQGQWAKRFHELGVPKTTAKALVDAFNEDAATAAEATEKADAKFAEETEAALRKEWGGDYDNNVRIAKTAAKELFGEDFQTIGKTVTKDDRLVLDHPAMLKMFAKVGREMSESTIPSLSDDEAETINDQVREVRAAIAKAQDEGDSKRANQLFQKEQALLKKMGNAPIVGSQGRAA